MTPQEFIVKWKRANLTERSAAQQHFLDLCELLGQPKPAAADPDGTHYTFERGAHKTDGGDGWADVWMQGHFGWEYKGKHKDLGAAYRQLLQYRESLDNPPLLVVCDLDRFEIHTNFTGTPKRVYAFNLEGLAEPGNLDKLRRLFTEPESLKPGQTTQGITEDVANRFGKVADSMRDRGIPAPQAAHFLMKLMFCMFAEDIRLLPERLFSKLLENAGRDPARLSKLLRSLFEAMAHGGDFGADTILHFNGGLFADADVVDLTWSEVDEVVVANKDNNWADVEPSIFGTLFERTLDPAKRSQIGAHYTSREDILTLLEPVVMAPLRREWAEILARCEELWPQIQEESRKQAKAGTTRKKASRPRAEFDRLLSDFVHRLAHVRILDPACGSGNFLYVAINLLLDLEKQVIAFGAAHGLTQLPQVRPTQLAGIEINPYAQQLAQVVIWIGYLQWMHHNGFNPPRNPVLDPIESIRCMDAIVDVTDPMHPVEAEWPESDFIVGNPPFLGGKRILGELGDSYTASLRRIWDGRLPRFSDLCCYWFEKSREQIAAGKTKRVGLLATQGIRGGANRECLNRIKETGDIYFAVSDRNWVLDGATVHVSMIGFDDGTEAIRTLDGTIVSEVHANLTVGTDVTKAIPLSQNLGRGFIGVQKSGPFDLNLHEAIRLTSQPTVNGLPASDVLRVYWTAVDVVHRNQDVWIIDFVRRDETDAAGFSPLFEHLKSHVPVERAAAHFASYPFWQLWRPRPEMYAAIAPLSRFLVTPHVSKHRIFAWAPTCVCPSNLLICVATESDADFGILQSRAHETWSRSQGTQLRERESGFRYTPTTCFETFPFPSSSNSQNDTIANAARNLHELRSRWLNPPEWIREEIIEFAGSSSGPWRHFLHDPNERGIGTVRYPRLVPVDEAAAKQLAKRTLTNLYNERPTWLDLAHRRLDEAVFAAYGWPIDLTDDQILERLLALNLERAAAEK